MTDNIKSDGTISDEVKENVERELKNNFRPEFINRIDDIIVFSPLTEAQIVQIIDLSMKEIQGRLKEREITLILTDAAKQLIAKEAYSPIYGARPVKRYLQKNIETQIAERIIRGEIQDGCTVTIDADGDRHVFKIR